MKISALQTDSSPASSAPAAGWPSELPAATAAAAVVFKRLGVYGVSLWEKRFDDREAAFGEWEAVLDRAIADGWLSAALLQRAIDRWIDRQPYPPGPGDLMALARELARDGLPTVEETIAWLTLAETGRRDAAVLAERYTHPLALAVASHPDYRPATVKTGSPAARAGMVEKILDAVLATSTRVEWPAHAHDRQQRLDTPPRDREGRLQHLRGLRKALRGGYAV